MKDTGIDRCVMLCIDRCVMLYSPKSSLVLFKDTLSGPRQFLVTGSPLKMKNAFYFTLKASLVFKISKFFS